MHLRKRSLAVTIGLMIAGGGLLTTASAVASTPQESNFDLEGPISKQSAGKLTIDQGQGIFFRVAYDDKTTIAKDDGSAASEKDLKVGVRVHVVGDLQASGEVKAARIEIETKQSQPGQAPQ